MERFPKRPLAAVTGLALATTVLAACGSSSGDSTTTTSSNTSNSSSTTTSSTSPASNPQVAAAQSAVAKSEADQTSLVDSNPLPKKPPTGISVVWLENDNPQTIYSTNGWKAATAALGWNLKVVPYKLEQMPSSFISAMDTALQYKPDVVVVPNQPISLWQSEIPKYEAAGVKILPDSVGTITSKSKILLPQSNPFSDFYQQGVVMANKFIADSNGAGQALVMNVPDISVLVATAQGFKDTVKKGCTNCKVTTINVPITQFTTDGGVSSAVSALQRNPDLKYLITLQGASDQGLPAALNTAGITGVKIIGANPSTTALQDVQQGKSLAMVGSSFGFLGWMSADVIAQTETGVAKPTSEPWPLQLLTQPTLQKMGKIPSDLDIPTNYPDLFKKRWLLN